MNHAQVSQQANTAVLKEAMNVQEMHGEGVMRLLASASGAPEQVRDPMLGQTVDTYA
jgi:hypothetical protein